MLTTPKRASLHLDTNSSAFGDEARASRRHTKVFLGIGSLDVFDMIIHSESHEKFSNGSSWWVYEEQLGGEKHEDIYLSLVNEQTSFMPHHVVCCDDDENIFPFEISFNDAAV